MPKYSTTGLYVGLKISQRGQGKRIYRYVVVDAQPYKRKRDGQSTTVFTLEGKCSRCRRPFFVKCGPNPEKLNRTCRYCLEKAAIEQRKRWVRFNKYLMVQRMKRAGRFRSGREAA